MDTNLILFVDDLAVQRKFFAAALESLGMQVMTADNAAAGLALAREFRPYLIISDFVMPEVNGVQFCSQVRRDPVLRHVIFLIATSVEPTREERDSFHDEPDGWIDKNLGADSFVEAVKAWGRLGQATV